MRAVFVAAFICVAFLPVAAQPASELDYSRVIITLTMDARHCLCMPKPSCCPEYSASINEKGTVIYNGLRGTKVQGEKVHSVPVSVVRELVSEFFRIDFFSLQDRYESKKHPNGTTETISHAPSSTITLDIDGKKKSVYSFYGAPEELTALQRKLLEALQVAQYAGKQ
jgi:hypothetical protein